MSIKELGWRINYRKFRRYLFEKYGVTSAFLFIGYVEKNTSLYKELENAGFICIFKPTLTWKDGTTKGNCDAELLLHTMIEYPNFQKAIIVNGDGDFFCLVKHLIVKNKFEALFIPNKRKFSALLKDFRVRPFLRFMNDLSDKISDKKEKAP
ncbi:NYN domain-containing protein [Patescibacteria group bacterium]|nr:NYN domain-containing protein [Patescibacteria group bacterium]